MLRAENMAEVGMEGVGRDAEEGRRGGQQHDVAFPFEVLALFVLSSVHLSWAVEEEAVSILFFKLCLDHSFIFYFLFFIFIFFGQRRKRIVKRR